ncbi:L-seryl-tRNA(Sec) kinase-like [Glandiceps talaboti]
MNAVDVAKGCVVVLCGLPGSGKTKFAKELNFPAEFYPATVYHICYDDFIPNNINFELCQVSNQETTNQSEVVTWKQLRNTLVHCIENMVARNQGCSASPESTTSHLSQVQVSMAKNDGNPLIKEQFEQKLKDKMYRYGHHGNLDESSDEICTLYIIDDNMFYRSMRYEYFQLARKYNLGFCQVYLHCPLEIAIQRNQQRPEPIPYKTMVAMETKLEVPDTKKYPWETKSVEIDVMETKDAREKVFDIIRLALSDPVPPLEVEDMAEKEAASEANAASIVHQADQVLRKCIADTMKKAKVSPPPGIKMNLKRLGKQLSALKNEILEDIKNHKIHLDFSNMAISQEEWHQDLQTQIMKIFHERHKLMCCEESDNT